MNTQILPAVQAYIDAAAALIRRGEVVAFPTETVYGLGANALDADAVRKIFVAKGRPGDNPLIVHVSQLEQIGPLIDGEMPEQAAALAAAYWPGPLTMIMKKSDRVPDVVSAGLRTVGIRMPSHPTARALIEKAGVPIAAPSANRSGKPSPTTAMHVLEDMRGRIEMILDGGACAVGLESTVLDVTVFPPRVPRPGGVTSEMVAAVCGAVEVDGSVMRPLQEGETVRSPGMKYRHYAPEARMTIVQGKCACAAIAALYDEAEAAGDKACILALTNDIARYGTRRTRDLGPDSAAAAANFFAALREMDIQGITRIYSETVELSGMGLAVMNRMGRAAAFDVIDADQP